MIQVYTGNGKGKTTSALGLALRACGAGHKIYIGQFIKTGNYCEIKALKAFANIKVEQFGRGCFIMGKPCKKDIELAGAGVKKIIQILKEDKFKLIILDEVNIALKLKLIKLQDLIEIINNTPKESELILTGRYAHPKIKRLADLVTEIREIKHYYKKGMRARRGIEF